MENINEFEKEFRQGDSGPKYMFRGPRFEWGILVLKPGQTLGKHFHNKVEETFFLEKGSVIMKINDKEIKAKAGDAFRLEPKESHDIINHSDVDARFIFIKVPYLPDDKVKSE
ncbi:MAG: cupin domain-containing protein [Spirochaetes bacterium]|nr:cupin domain-containing protein [Spirochaetota bacterium]